MSHRFVLLIIINSIFLLFLHAFADTGRGLMASRDISPNSIVISIPERFIISTKSVAECAIKDYIIKYKSGVRLSPLEALAFFVMYEKSLGLNSTWFPYLNMLPSAYSLLHLWSDDELELLPTFISSSVSCQKQDVKCSYEKIKKVIMLMCNQQVISESQIEIHFNFYLFQWALSTLMTRSVYMKQKISYNWLTADADVCALVPFLDMFNHSPAAKMAAGFNEHNQHYEIKTFDSFKKFDQVFITYGSHDNTNLLINYGFLWPDNPNDCVMIQFGLFFF
ncbi:hypothetical protein HELRODRAFT_77693 [Helobdella robusta]|uniref:SET domain-containing protein n=1 Tax=Helobdella robusta TaxID=6412 RepID=T1G324_HELRO|nr:hypothetical protein HELRODRAFT_77693 [Helobdella robusta]ESO05339.1 hypothetical protein HELRODRAFT_77693 [Helobdella robusta]